MITLPDIQAVTKHVAQGELETTLFISPAGGISAIDILYGFGPYLEKGNHFMAHKTAFTEKTLTDKLIQAGFSNVEVKKDGCLNLWAVGYKLGK